MAAGFRHRQGILVLTETHFSMVVMPKNRQRSKRSEPTPEDAGYRGVLALAGTYTVSGSRATFKRVANLNADLIGLDLEAEFKVDGDRLTTPTISGGVGTGAEIVWKKVG